MTSSASPPNFSMIQAGQPWVNKDGTPTTAFFRLVNNLFHAAGAGSTSNISLSGLINEAFSGNIRHGTDYERQIADVVTLLSTLPNPEGRIATLEKRIADLEQMLYESKRTVDLNPMQTQLDNVTAYVMGVR